jgi:hypothetical protein
MSWVEVAKTLIFWGPGALIAGLIIFAIYKLADKFAGKAIEAQQAQAVALGNQAKAMESLQQSMHDYVNRDNNEHREMLVLMKYTAQHIQSLLIMKGEHDRRQQCETEG